MRARTLLVLVSLLLPFPVKAQEDARTEVFAGYSYLGYYIYPAYTGPWTRKTYNGFESTAAFHILPHVSAEADLGLQGSIQTFMGGGRVSGGSDKMTLYGHALFGALRLSAGQSGGDTTKAMAFGGGANLWFARRFGARIIQLDYIRNNNPLAGYFAHPVQHAHYRVSTGVVFRF